MFHHVRGYMLRRSLHWIHIREMPIIGRACFISLQEGETLPYNQSEGNEPSCRDLEKITCGIGAISQQSLWRSKGSWSYVWFQALQQFHDTIYRTVYFLHVMVFIELFLASVGTLSGLMWPDSWMSCTFCEHIWSRVRGDLGVNTNWNWCSDDLPSSFLRGELPWESCLQFFR